MPLYHAAPSFACSVCCGGLGGLPLLLVEALLRHPLHELTVGLPSGDHAAAVRHNAGPMLAVPPASELETAARHPAPGQRQDMDAGPPDERPKTGRIRDLRHLVRLLQIIGVEVRIPLAGIVVEQRS